MTDLADPQLYVNCEASWLEFNARVLEEALDPRHPLLERVKFLAIYAGNLDEFFMIRVSGLRRLLAASPHEAALDGQLPAERFTTIRRTLLKQLATASACWQQDVLPKLHDTGIRLRRYAELTPDQRGVLREYFLRDIFPVLTPLAFDPGHPFPHISNLSLNLAIVIDDPEHGERFARLKVPDHFPRLLRIPDDAFADTGIPPTTGLEFAWLEEVIAANLDLLFPGLTVQAAYPFRVTRDADMEIEEDEAADLLATVEEHIEMRDFGLGIRLEVDKSMPVRIRGILMHNLGISPPLLYACARPIGMASLLELTRLDRPDLKDTPFTPAVPPALATPDIFTAIRAQDILLFHPYDSFGPVIEFVEQAARDPHVLAIKQALYRVGLNSPIVDALLTARDEGKQVAVLVELKARFDEENNIAWARKLEENGVHVVYGLVGLKTHAKVCLVVRQEPEGIMRYMHLGTGNYNPSTAKVYTDLGFFTCDPGLGADVTDLFNALTGYSRKTHYRKLLVAPGDVRAEIVARIEREIRLHRQAGGGYLAFKMNALTDPACIHALYRASQAGVVIDLQVRGMCCLRPGLPGVSETITVTSLVGRFLEHARLYYFRNGGDEEIYLGSADLMPRNLDRRVETLFPINDPALRRTLREEILLPHLHDTAQARRMRADGTYERLQPADGAAPRDAQTRMLVLRARPGGA